MKITLDTEVIENYKWSIEETILLLYLSLGSSLNETLDSLRSKGLIYIAEGTYRPFFKACDRLENILNESLKVQSAESLLGLATTLMALMPQGKVEGTPYYFKCNKHEVTQSLQRFYADYNMDNEYSQEDIIKATELYVKSFNGDYKYMSLLKNFIYRNKDTDSSSELASYLENMKDESS